MGHPGGRELPCWKRPEAIWICNYIFATFCNYVQISGWYVFMFSFEMIFSMDLFGDGFKPQIAMSSTIHGPFRKYFPNQVYRYRHRRYLRYTNFACHNLIYVEGSVSDDKLPCAKSRGGMSCDYNVVYVCEKWKRSLGTLEGNARGPWNGLMPTASIAVACDPMREAALKRFQDCLRWGHGSKILATPAILTSLVLGRKLFHWFWCGTTGFMFW